MSEPVEKMVQDNEPEEVKTDGEHVFTKPDVSTNSIISTSDPRIIMFINEHVDQMKILRGNRKGLDFINPHLYNIRFVCTLL